MSYELRPCLRCGIKDEDWSNNIVTSTEWEGEIITGYWIICECGLSIYGANEEQAVKRWNTRPVEDRLLAKLESIPWEPMRISVALSFMAPINEPPNDPRIVASIWLEQNSPREEEEDE